MVSNSRIWKIVKLCKHHSKTGSRSMIFILFHYPFQLYSKDNQDSLVYVTWNLLLEWKFIFKSNNNTLVFNHIDCSHVR